MRIMGWVFCDEPIRVEIRIMGWVLGNGKWVVDNADIEIKISTATRDNLLANFANKLSRVAVEFL